MGIWEEGRFGTYTSDILQGIKGLFSVFEVVDRIEVNTFLSLLLPWLLECCEGYFAASEWQAWAGDGEDGYSLQ